LRCSSGSSRCEDYEITASFNDLYDTIVFDGDEPKALEIAKSASFDLGQLDDEGNNLMYHAESNCMDSLIDFLNSKGIERVCAFD
jgi:hypothetical protein